MNILNTRLDRGLFQLGSETLDTGLDFSGPVDVGIRPEAIRLDGSIPATVVWVENLGLHSLIGLRIGTAALTALAPERPPSSGVSISVSPKDLHVFDKDSGANLSRHRTDRTVRA